MKRFKPRKFPHNLFSRVIAATLIFALSIPQPLASYAASQENTSDAGHEVVLRRLNSEERKAAIAAAVERDAAMRAERAKNETGSVILKAGGVAEVEKQGNDSAVSPLPRHHQADSRPENKKISWLPQEPSGPPKSGIHIFMNAATGMLGLPGSVAPNAQAGAQMGAQAGAQMDEGRGFHQDGSVRKAPGNSQTEAGHKRVEAYSRYAADAAYKADVYGPGFDPVTRQSNRYGDPFAGVRLRGGSLLDGQTSSNERYDPRDARRSAFSYGFGLLNSAGETMLSGAVEGGRAQLNFNMDGDGKFEGEGDVLYPLYDGTLTTMYTQLGARSMWDDRWIGNAGLGQRWYPFASGEGGARDSGNLMLGYNAFFDYDFTRYHQRGSVGGEVQYDWLKLSSNYYLPLSSWRAAKGDVPDFYVERPAKGWDARLKGYLPFYRNIALTGSYSQWYGSEVGVFSSSDREKDPKVWAYGLEYTPIPLVSGFLNQRQTERGDQDTELGLRFTYHFHMPWEEQIRPSKVAEMRTVGGSRYEFVDRENKIILEYKLKASYSLEVVSLEQQGSGNRYRATFRLLRDGTPASNVQVRGEISSGSATLSMSTPPDDTGAAQTFLARAGMLMRDLFTVSKAYADVIARTKTTDANGLVYFDVDNPLGLVTLQATASGNAAAARATASVSINGLPPGLILTLNNPGTFPVGELVNNVGFTLLLDGRPVPAQNIGLNWSGPGAFLQSLPTSYAMNGSDVALNPAPSNQLTGLTPGVVTLTVTLADGVTTASYSLQVVSGALSLSLVNPATRFVVGRTESNVSFVLKEGALPIPDQNINLAWTGTGEFTAPPASAIISGGGGQFTLASLTSENNGPVTLTATLADGRTAIIILNVEHGNLALTHSGVVTVGVAGSVEFNLMDGGIPEVAGTAMILSWAGSGGTPGALLNPPATAVIADNQGRFFLNLTGQSPGAVTLTVTLADGATASTTLTINQGTLNLTLSNPSIFNVGTAENNVIFTVREGGQPVPDQSLSLAWSGGGAFTTPPGGANINGGNGQFTLASLTGQTAGVVTLTVTLADSRTVSTNVTVNNGVLRLTITKSPFSVGATTNNTVFRVLEGSLPVANQSVNLGWTGTGAFNTPPDSANISGGNGQFTLASLTGQRAGTVNLSITLADGRTVNANLTVNNGVLSLTMNGSPAFNVGAVTNNVSFTFMEGSLPVPNGAITLAWSDYNGEFLNPPGSATVSGGAGQFTVASLTGLQAGALTLTATVNGRSAAATLTINSGALSLALSSSSTFNVGSATSNATFTLMEGSLPVPNQGVTLAWSTAGGAFLNPPSSAVVSGGAGRFIVGSLTGQRSGSVTLTATVGGRNVSTTLSIAGGGLSLTMPGGYTFNVGSATANPGFIIMEGTVPVPNQNINLAWSSTDGAFQSPPTTSSVTGGNGRFTLSSLTGLRAGSVTLTVTLADSRTVTTNLTINSGVLSLTLNGSPTFSVGATTNNVAFTVREGGLTVPNQSITLAWSGSGAFAGPPSSAGISGGNGQFTLPTLTGQTTGIAALTLTLANNRTVAINLVVEDGNLHLAVVGSPGFTVGAAVNATFTLTEGGLPVPNQNITLAWSTTGGTFLTPPGSAAISGGAGQFTLNGLTGSRAGYVTLTATISGGRQVAVNLLVNNGVLNLSLYSSSSFNVGSATNNVIFTLREGTLPVPNQSITLAWSGTGGAFLSPPNSAAVSGGAGRFTIASLTGQQAGSVTVTATVNGRNVSTNLTIGNGILSLALSGSPNFTVGTQVNALFTVREGTVAVPNQGITLAWSTAGGAFLNPPGSSNISGGSGNFSLSNLTGQRAGSVTLTVTLADSRTVSTVVTVNNGTLNLTLNGNPNFSVGSATGATFTLREGNLFVPAQSLTLAWSGGGAFVTPPANANISGTIGEFTLASLTGQTAGSANLTVTLANGRSVSIVITVNNGVLSLTLNGSPNFTVGSVTSANFTLREGSLPVYNQSLTLTWGGTGTFTAPPGSASTGGGQFNLTGLTGKTAGTANLTVTLANGRSVGTTLNVTNGVLSLTLSSSSIFNVGAATNNVIFTVREGSLALPAQSLSLAWGGSGAFATPPAGTAVSGGSGQFTLASLTGKTAGTVTLTVTLADSRTVSTNVTVNNGVLRLTITGSPLSVGATTNNIVIRVLEGSLPVPNQNVSLGWTGTGTFVTPPAGASINDGNGQFTLASLTGKTAGVASMTITLADGRTLNVNLTVNNGVLSLTINGSPTFNVGAVTNNVSFTFMEGSLPVPNGAITLDWSEYDGEFLNPPGNAVVSGGSGQFTVASLTGLQAGALTLTATVNGRSASATLTVNNGTLSLVLSSASTFNVGSATSNATFTLMEGSLPVPNQGVTLAWSTAGGAFLNPPSSAVVSGGAGRFIVGSLTGQRSGSVTLTATVGGRNVSTTLSIAGGTLSLTMPGGYTFNVGDATANPGFIIMEGTVPVPNQNINLAWSSTGGAFQSPPATSSVTGGNGRFTLSSLTGLRAGSVTLTVTLADSRTVTTSLTVGNGVLDIIVDSGAQFSVGTTTSATFTVREGTLPVPNQSITLAWTNSDGAFLTPPNNSSIGGNNGQFTLATLTGQTAGIVTLTVTLADSRIVTIDLVVEDGNLDITLVGSPGFTVGAAVNATFTVTEGGIAVPGQSITLAWTSTDGAFLTPPGSAAISGGAGQFTLNGLTGLRAGYVTLTATISGGREVAVNLLVNSGVLSLTLNGSPNFTVGSATSATFTLREGTLPVPNQNITLAWSGTGGAFLSPPNSAAVSGGAGQFTLPGLTGQQAGSVTLTATVSGRNVSTSLIINNGSLSLTLSGSPNFAVGTEVSAVFTVREGTVAVPNQGITLAWSSTGGAFLNPPGGSNISGGSGNFSLTNLTGQRAGSVTLTVTLADSRTISTVVTVNNGVLSLTLHENPNFSVGSATGATFTVREGNLFVPAQSLTLAWSGGGTFVTPPANANISGTIGEFTLASLTGQTAGSANLTVTLANGRSVGTVLTINNGVLSLTIENSPVFSVGVTTSNVVFTVREGSLTVPNQSITLSWAGPGAFSAPPNSSSISGGAGRFTLASLTGQTVGTVTMSVILSGGRSVNTDLTVTQPARLFFPQLTSSGSFSGNRATVGLTVQLENMPVFANQAITWEVVAANNSANQAVSGSHATRRSGLAWGSGSPAGDTEIGTTTSSSNASGLAVISLVDTLGERTVTVKASVTVNSTTYTTANLHVVTFGPGPLAELRLPGSSPTQAPWANSVPITGATEFPAAELCGGFGNPNWPAPADYSAETRLPTATQLLDVSGSNGAGIAAGWPDFTHWTGELVNENNGLSVYMPGDFTIDNWIGNWYYVICRR